MKTAEEEIANIEAIGRRLNAMRLAAPADDPYAGACFKAEALCGKLIASIRSNHLAAAKAGLSVEEYLQREDERAK